MHGEAQIKPVSVKGKEYKKISCSYCKSENTSRFGTRKTNRGKLQRYKCKDCNKTFILNDGFVKMRYKPQIITMALDLYFNGLSSRKVAKYFQDFLDIKITHKDILNWISKFIRKIKQFTDNLKPTLSKIFHADEIFVRCNKEQHYFWDVVDKDTRFLLATHYSTLRDGKTATKFFRKIKERPIRLFTDRLGSYGIAWKKTFGQKRGITNGHIPLDASKDRRNNIIERIQGTIRDRIKVMRSFKNKASAENILDGIVIWYNYIRVHQGINMTPSDKAGINLGLGVNRWLGLITLSV
jgi:putative transposase